MLCIRYIDTNIVDMLLLFFLVEMLLMLTVDKF